MASSLESRLETEALTDNLHQVLSFLEQQLDNTACSMKVRMQITMAAEEIFVNIAHYAYGAEVGKAVVISELSDTSHTMTITFIDSGTPYDPLEKEDPDVTLSAEERKTGGLGIFLTKKFMDNVEYSYEDGKNIFKMQKKLF